MTNRFNKVMSWLLILSMIFQMIPVSLIPAYAQDETQSVSSASVQLLGDANTSSVKYKVTYSGSNMQDVTFSQDVTEGESFVIRPAGTCYNQYGDKFDGWYDSTGAKYEPGATVTMPSGNLALSASCVARQNYNVTFELGEGSLPATSMPGTLTCAEGRENGCNIGWWSYDSSYNFSGWYDKATGEKYSFPFTMPSRNLNLVGMLSRNSENKHTLSYAVSGDIPEGYTVPSIQTVTSGQTVITAAASAESGYTFVGWTYNGVTYNSSEFEMPNSDVVMTGVWMESSDGIVVRTNSGAEKTYDGHSLPVEVTVNVNDANVEYSTDGENWSSDVPSITDAGTLTCYVKVSHPDYETVEKTVTLTVNPTTLTVTPGSSGSYNATGWVNGETGTVVLSGDVANPFTITGGTAKAENYKIVTSGIQTKRVWYKRNSPDVGPTDYLLPCGDKQQCYYEVPVNSKITVANLPDYYGYIIHGWTSGRNTYSGGEEVTVDSDIEFTLYFVEPEAVLTFENQYGTTSCAKDVTHPCVVVSPSNENIKVVNGESKDPGRVEQQYNTNFAYWTIRLKDGTEKIVSFDLKLQPSKDDDPEAHGVWTDRTYIAHFIEGDYIPDLKIEKSASPKTVSKAGVEISYTVKISNPGNIHVNVTLEDKMLPADVNPGTFTLEPDGGEKYVYYTYTVQEDDLSKNSIYNVATAHGVAPVTGSQMDPWADATVTIEKTTAKLSVSKSATPESDVTVGDNVSYTVLVKNEGSDRITNISLVDTLVKSNDSSWQPAPDAFDLGPNEEKSFTYGYKVTADDVAAGKIVNTVTAKGKDSSGKDVADSSTKTVTTVDAEAKIEVTKEVDKKSGVKAGETVKYTITVKNTGNVTITNLVLNDVLEGIELGDLGETTLKPNQTTTATATYTVQQKDVDAGEIKNTVTATGKAPDKKDVTGTASAEVTTEDASAKLSITKAANPTENVKVGDTVTYTVVVTNTGNVSVKDGKLKDNLVDLSDKTFTLAPNETETFTYEYTVTQTDVDTGSFTNTVKANATAVRGTNPAEVTATATVTTVTKITITANSNAWTYDGNPHQDTVVTVTSGTLRDGDKLVAEATGSVTNVSDTADGNNPIKAGYKIMHGDEDVTANYQITVVSGTLTINKRPVTFTGETDTRDYTGSEIELTGVAVSTGENVGLVNGHTHNVIYSAKGIEPNVYDGTITAKEDVVIKNGDTVVTDNYDITVINGKLTIVLGNADYTIHHYLLGTTTKVADDENGTATVGTVVTPAAVIPETYEGLTLSKDSQTPESFVVAVSGNEFIVYYTVAMPITVKGNNDTKTYDSASHTAEGYTATNSSSLFDESKVSYSGEAKATRQDVGTTNMNLDASGFSYDGPDYVKATFTITEDGYMKIDPKAVTITAKDASKPYDGTPLTQPEYTISELESGDTHTFTVAMTAESTITEVGTKPNVIATVDGVIVTTEKATEVGNYLVTIVNGTLEITNNTKAIVITSSTKSWVYDGETHTDEVYTVTYDGQSVAADATGKVFTLPTSDTITITATAAGVKDYDASYSENNTYTYVLTNAGNYSSVTTNFGTLSIEKAPLTITAKDQTYTYNGSAQGEDNATYTSGFDSKVTVSGLQGSDALTSITLNGQETNAGVYPGKIAPSAAAVGTATDNYEIKYVNGKLTISKDTMTLTATDYTGVYDGAYHSITASASVTNGTTIYYSTVDPESGDFNESDWSTTNPQYKNVSETPVTVYVKAENPNYETAYASATVTITKRPVTIIAADSSKVYGTADPAFVPAVLTGGIGNELAGIALAVTRSNSDEAVGTYTNVLSIAATKAALEAEYMNYTFTVTPATFKITPAEVTVKITGNTETKTYNGEEQNVTGYTVSIPSGVDLKADEINGPAQDAAIAKGTDVDGGTNSDKTYPMGLTSAQFSTTNTNYTVTFDVTDGWLKIIPAALTVTITGHHDTKTYNGQEQSVSGYDITIPEGATLTAAEISGPAQTVAATGTAVDGGSNSDKTYPMGLKVSDFSSTTNKNYTVTFAVTDGWLKIEPAIVTVTADNKSKVYGDSDPAWTATVTGLVNGESEDLIKYNLSRESGENVGTYAITPSGSTTQGNYKVNYVNGTLTITKANVTVTADDKSKTYGDDDPALTATVTGLKNGDTASAITYTLSRVAGEDVGDYTITPAGEAVQGNYDVEYVPGTLTIDPKEVTVKADDNGKVYGDDDPALTATVTGLRDGDSISYSISRAEGENVSNYTITPTGAETQGNYKVKYETGTFTITRATVIVTAEDKTKVYGTADPEFTATVTGLKRDDDESVISYSLTRTAGEDVGTYPITPKGAAVQGNYNVVYEPGTLTITKAEMTLTAVDYTGVYDGASHNGGGIPSVTNGTTLTYSTDGGETWTNEVPSITNVGSQTYMVKATNPNYEDVTATGTLIVTARPITIKAADAEKTYDGTPLTKGEYSITSGSLADGDSIKSDSVTVTGSRTVYGTSANVASGAVIVKSADDTVDVTSNYAITYAEGTLSIKQREITITAGSDEKVYDGTALTKGTYEITTGTLAEGDKIDSINIAGSQTVVGESANTASETQIVNAANENVTSSYKITYVEGTLKVTKKAVTITADSAEKVYDGTELTKDTATGTGLAATDSIGTVTVTGSRTDVGSAVNTASNATIVNGAGVDVTGSYEITYATGTLTVTAKPITITADSDSKVYDGDPLTMNSYTSDDLAEGDAFTSVTVTGSQTVVGKSDNVPSAAVIKRGDTDVTSNYSITYKNGTLEVTKKAVTITADSGSKPYDGTALTKDSATPDDGLATGDKLDSITVTGSQTVVGSSDNVASAAKIVNAAGTDVTASYDITYVKGTLTVTEREITITAESDTKVYDGTELTKNSYINTELGSGDKVESVTVTGSQTVVGESDNVPSNAKIVNAAGDDVTSSYKITYANGTLEVTPKALTITAHSGSKVYDGTALTVSTYTKTDLAEGDSISSISIAGSQTNVGKSDNTPSAAKIVNEDGTDVTASYAITYVKGSLEVTKKALTITANNDTKVYDGTALTNNGYSSTGLASTDRFDSVTVTGSQTVVGSSANVPSAATIRNRTNEDVTENYEITYDNGTLEVTAKALTITADSDTKVYDGTPLTKNSYTNTALAAGDKVDIVTVTGSQTVVGSSNNVPSAAKIVNASGEDVTASYAITYQNGTLEVTKKAVTITADSDTKVYDGTALTKDSYTNTALGAGDSLESVTVTGSQTVVGSSDNVPSAATIVDAEGEDVTSSYDITYKIGTLTVTKRAVTITAENGTKPYDGTALTKESYTNTALGTGDSISSVTVTGSQTVVGESDNVPSAAVIMHGETDVTSSYEITYANGTLEVTPKTLTITADTDSKVYDGTALTVSTYTNTDLADGDIITSVSIAGSQTNVGTSANTPTAAKIVNSTGEDVTASYDINFVSGTLTVTQKPLKITANSDTRVYNGVALTNNGYSSTGLASTDRFSSVTVTGSQTEVGTSDNVPSAAKILNSTNQDVTGNYEITYDNGTLEVTKMPVTITAASDTKVYDGIALTNDGYTNTTLAFGDKVQSVTVTGSQTVVGESANVPSAAKIVNKDGKDVTASYDITYVNGLLSVTLNRSLIITADSDTKVYDGSELKVSTYQAAGLTTGDHVESVTVTGSQTVVGKSDNVPSAAKIVNAAGVDVTSSYEITYVNGTLTVTPKAITITADSDTKPYDGTALTKDSYTYTTLAEGDSINSVTVTGSQIEAGTSDNVPSNAKIVNGNGDDVTSSYDITYANGTLEVTPKALTITADSGSKVYDGTALTVSTYTNTDLAVGDSISSISIAGSQTNVGKSDNTPSVAKIVNEDGTDVTASYDINYVKGSLEVTKKALTITANNDTKVYDGTALTNNGYSSTGLASTDRFDFVTVTGSQTVVGSSANVPSAAKILNRTNEDVTGNYEITYDNGTLEVTAKTLTITADSDTKVYDGTPLTKDSYTNTALAAGDSISSVIVTGSQTVVGSSDNVPSAAKIVNASGEDVTASYAIEYVNGLLSVTLNRTLIITADDDTKVYDGTSLTISTYKIAGLANGDSVKSVTVDGSQTTVGSSANVPSDAKIINAAGEDVTASYAITYKNGTLTVTAKPLTITAASDSKTYDGTALTKNEYTATDLASGHSFESVTVTGSQTVVGSSANKASDAKIINAAKEDVTANYDISYIDGSLTVNKKIVTITADSDSKTYDGSALTKDSYTATDLAAGDKFTSVTVTGSQTNAGTSANVASDAKIVNDAGTDVTDSYTINYVDGSLTVSKKSVTITADSASKAYDGTALEKDSYTATELVNGHSFDDVTVTGSQTVVGSSANVASDAKIANAAGADVTDNYVISYVDGQLTVTKKVVTITADSGSKTYDGTALTKNSYTNTELGIGDSIDSVTMTGSQTVVGSSANVASAAKIVNEAKEDVTGYYDIFYTNGTLTVSKKAITITADSASKTYDGIALTKDGFTNTELGSGDSITVTVTGSQTVVGSSANVPSAAKIVNADNADVTACYDITYVNGTLRVSQNAVTITAGSGEKEYDGTALTVNTYMSEGLAEGDSIRSASVTGSRTVAGSSENVVSDAVIVNRSGEDVTASYIITYEKGKLTVTPKALTITADDAEKDYDGTALKKKTYTSEGLIDGDEIDFVTVTGSQTNAGSTPNVPSDAKIVNEAGDDVTDSYSITYTNGTLTVKPINAVVTIIGNISTVEYDGESHTVTGYKATVDNDLYDATSDFTFSGEASVSRTDFGKTEMGLDQSQFSNTNTNFATVIFNVTDGYQEITPKTVTITANSNEFTYNGTAQSDSGYEVIGLVGDDEITAVVSGSITFPSESPVANKLESYEFAVGNLDNYTVETVDGKLTMINASVAITITSASDEWTYDGGNHENTEVTLTSGTLLTGDELVAEATGSVRNVYDTAEGNNPIAAGYKIMHGDIDVTDNYDITPVNGTLTVKKAALKITANDQSYSYTGEARGEFGETYTDSAEISEKVIVEGLVGGDTLSGIKLDGNAILTGVYEKRIVPSDAVISKSSARMEYARTASLRMMGALDLRAQVTGSGNSPADNYDISYVPGTLTISSSEDPIVVVPADGEKTYDGKPLTKTEPEDFSVTGVPEGFTWTAAADGTVTNVVPGAGEKAVNAVSEFHIFNSEGLDVTNQFSNIDTTATGTLTINPRSVTLTSASASKVYDGKPLTKNEQTDITVGGDGFVDGEGAVYKITGSQTLVGSCDNEFTYELNEGMQGSNYRINSEFGVLTVTDVNVPDELVVTKTAEEAVYKAGDEVTFTITATNVYDEPATIEMEEIEGVSLEKSSFENVPAGETVSTVATYTITEKDILNGGFTNTVTVKIGNKSWTAEKSIETEDSDGKLIVEKETTSEPENGTAYALGETIEYKITVTNVGNVTISDVVVKDALTKDEWEIGTLEPGQSSTAFEAAYIVTEADVLNGSVANVATATGKTPDDKDPDVTPGETEDDTEDPKGELTIVKTTTSEPANGETAYKLGDTITYSITVTNTGNVTLSNVEVTDDLTKDKWTVETLAPNGSASFETSHTVTEEDVKAGKVVNEATGTGTMPGGEEPTVIPGKTEDPVEMRTIDIEVTKVWDDLEDRAGFRPTHITVNLLANGTKVDSIVKYGVTEIWTMNFVSKPVYGSDGVKIEYTVEEESVEFKYPDGTTGSYSALIEGSADEIDGRVEGFTITNTLERELIDVHVQKIWDDNDNQDGKRPDHIILILKSDVPDWEDGYAYVRENELGGWEWIFPNMDKYYNGKEILYRIEEEAVDGYITDITGEQYEGYVVTNSYEPETRNLTVTKIWDDNNDFDRIRPATITLNLYGNGSLAETAVVSGSGSVWRYTFTDLPVYEDGVEITYTVEEEEVEDYTAIYGANYFIRNTHEPEYTLTIYYRYLADGSTAAPTHISTHKAGERYGVYSPGIPGYQATLTLVSGRQTARNLEYVVYYYVPTVVTPPENEPPVDVPVATITTIDIDDLGTALGLGNLARSAGEGFE